MARVRSLYSLDEWNDLVDSQEITSPPTTLVIGYNSIGCPSFLNDRGDVCGAHMVDMPFVVMGTKRVGHAGKPIRRIYCEVCRVYRWRRVAECELDDSTKSWLRE